MGAVLAGSTAVVERAGSMLRRIGGASVHRAGIAAAAALIALDTTFHMAAEDHRRAKLLAEGLSTVPLLEIDPDDVETNIVLVDASATGLESDALVALLRDVGVGVLASEWDHLRLVTHRGISDDDVAEAVARIAESVERYAVELEPSLPVEGLEEAPSEPGDDDMVP
jgi:threonine aldolase